MDSLFLFQINRTVFQQKINLFLFLNTTFKDSMAIHSYSSHKLLIINTSTGWGGLELNVVKLARQFALVGVELHFIVRKEAKFAIELKNEFSNVLEIEHPKKYVDIKNAKVILAYLEKHSITKVFSPFRPDLDVLFWTKRKSKQQLTIVHQQHMQIGIPKKGWYQKLRYKCVDEWIAPLESLKAEVLAKTIVPASKITVIPIGVDCELFESKTYEQSEARALLKCQTTSIVLGIIGRIEEKKGQLFLVKAVHELRQKGEDVALLIVGSPTINDPKGKIYYDELVNYISLNNMSEYVFFSDFTNDVAQFYAAIDVFVMSSESETYGMVTLEALLSGKPVIGTNAGGTPELLNQGEFGELYECGDTTSFLAAYQSMQQRIKKQSISFDECKKHVRENFSLSKELEGLTKLLFDKN